jgi:vacuolar protein sorting-associated protein 13A/C
VNVSDVKLALTEKQYGMIVDLLLRSIPRVLAGAPEGQAQADSFAGTPRRELSETEAQTQTTVAMKPELLSAGFARTTVELAVAVGTIKLQLYGRGAAAEDDLKQHGIGRFALTGNSLRMKTLSGGAMEGALRVLARS